MCALQVIPSSLGLACVEMYACSCACMQARDSPGLLRTISWVLNGMGMRVVHAVCETLAGDSSAIARDTFWISDYKGRKVGRGA